MFSFNSLPQTNAYLHTSVSFAGIIKSKRQFTQRGIQTLRNVIPVWLDAFNPNLTRRLNGGTQRNLKYCSFQQLPQSLSRFLLLTFNTEIFCSQLHLRLQLKKTCNYRSN